MLILIFFYDNLNNSFSGFILPNVLKLKMYQSFVARLKLQMRGIQVDNQLPFTPMPVLLRMQRAEDHLNYTLKFSLTKQASGSLDLCVYPYLGFEVR